MAAAGQAQDEAFTGDANVDHKAMRVQILRSESCGSRTGELNVLAARGGFAPDVAETDIPEREPLLSSSGARDGNDGSDNSHFAEFKDLPWYRRPSIYWVLIPFGIIALAFGGVITPRVNIIINLLCRQYFDDKQEMISPGTSMLPISLSGSNPQCNIPEISSRASMFTLYGNLIGGLLSAFTSPKLGALSDRYGRTKMIAITSVGSLSGDIIFVLAAKSGTISVNWILVSYALDGVCGSFTTAMALVHAYATDCVPISMRNVAFGYFHGCLFTGIAAGPILAGLLTNATGTPLSSFYIMLGVHMAFVLYMLFLCPESLSKRRQNHAREKYKRAKSLRSTDWIEHLREINLVAPLKILWPTGPGTNSALRRNLVLLALIDTMMFGIAMGSMTVILIYVRQVFGWESYQSGIYLTVVNTTRVMGLFVVLPILNRVFRGKPSQETMHRTGSDLFDVVIIRVAIFFDTLGYLGYTLATTGPMMIGSGVIAALGGMASPTLQSALTKHVPPEKTGQLLGATGLMHALAKVIGPTIFNGIFSATAGTLVQTVFICLTSTFALAFVCSWFVKPGVTLEPTSPAQNPADEERTPLIRDANR